MEPSPDAFVRDDPRWPVKFVAPTETDSRGYVREAPVEYAVIVWCNDQFGDDPDRWRYSQYHIAFRDENDAVAFRMRWG